MMKNRFFIFLCIFTVSICFSCKKKDSVQEPVTFTFFSADLNKAKPFTDETAREITRRTGVFLDNTYSSLNPTDAILLMIANNRLPDLIFAKGDLTKLIEAGAVIPLDDYIEKYGQNMKKLYGDQIVRLRNTIDDPSIYSVGTYEIKTKNYEISGNMQLQHAVLKEFKYPQIKTLEDYENILQAYIKKYPEINGHKTIGLSLMTDSWYWYLGLSNPGNYLIGYADDGQWIVNQETMEATYKFMHPEMFQFYKWLNKIYHKGLLDPESFTQDYELWRDKLLSGYVLGTTYPYWEIKEVNNQINQTQEERSYAYLAVTADEKYKDPTMKDYGFSGGWGIAITSKCKDPERAFKFLDWMCSEEAQVLVNWGIEGKHYYYDNYGIRKFMQDNPSNSGIGSWVYPFPEAGSGYVDSTGNYLTGKTKFAIKNNYTYTEKETLKAYGVEMWTDLFPTSEELGISKYGQVWQYSLPSAMNDRIAKADDYVKNALIKMILGPEDKFDESWKNMQNKLSDLKIQEIEEEVTQLIKMKIELWEK